MSAAVPMHARERRAVTALAGLYGLRLLGMYMVLPVLSLYAAQLRDTSDLLIGLTVGCYGLAQGLLQIPLGALGDRFGRRRILTIGLLLFSLGSVVAAVAQDAKLLVLGRLLQGSGAIASTVVALIADLTRPQVRTRAMAMVGAAVAVSFGVGMVVGPTIAASFGVPALFWLMAALSTAGAIYVVVGVDRAPDLAHSSEIEWHTKDLKELFRSPTLLRLNLGIFALHAMTTAMFVVGPGLLSLHIAPARHGLVYLALIPFGMVLMRWSSQRSDRSGRLRDAILLAAVMVSVGNLLLWLGARQLPFFLGAIAMIVGAVALAEPAMPTMLSRLAPPASRGTAAGLFHSCEFVGSFVGGVVGGLFLSRPGTMGAWLLILALGWTALSWGLPHLGPARGADSAPG